MRFRLIVSLWAALAVQAAATAHAAEDPAQQVKELRRMLEEMKTNYEARIEQLEQRLDNAERAVAEARDQASSAEQSAEDARDTAEEVAMQPVRQATPLSALNPGIDAVLVGSYGDFDVGGEDYAIPGFIVGPESGPGDPGFSLGESEFNMYSNIDDRFFGNVTFSLHDEGGETGVELEEAYLQTLTLPAGLRVRGGRFFSDIGYLNSFHPHADEFTDRPLPYQAFLGRNYRDDGVQVSWLAPTDTFLLVGAEAFKGGGFPANAEPGAGAGAWTLFAHTGGDIGISNSWAAGLSYLHADVDAGRVASDGTSFVGESKLWIADAVYKWAPDGNPRNRNFKLQGEYFARSEDGDLGGVPYSGDQNGWYLQGIYQFAPHWSAGYRYDRLHADGVGTALSGTPLDPLGLSPERHSLVLQWQNSEFSKVRFQFTRDDSTPVTDNQFFIQYIATMGAHPAHQF